MSTTDPELVRQPRLVRADRGDTVTVVGWRYEPLHAGNFIEPAPSVGQYRGRRPHGATMPQRNVALMFARLVFGAYSDDGVAGPAECRRNHPGLVGVLPPHVEGEHDAPAADCQCGFRVVEDLTKLQRYIVSSERMITRRGFHRSKTTPLASTKLRASAL